MTAWKFKNGKQVPLAYIKHLPVNGKIKVYECAMNTLRGKYPSINTEETVKAVIQMLENDKDFLDEWGSPS